MKLSEVLRLVGLKAPSREKKSGREGCKTALHGKAPHPVSYWRDRLSGENSRWYELRPFSHVNDPLFGCPSSARAELVREAREALPQGQASDGLTLDEFENQLWKTLSITRKEEMRANNAAVSMYSEQVISLRVNTQIGLGPLWKRGTRGNLLSMQALDELPNRYKEKILDSMKKNEGLALCHIDGIICLLPHQDLRFPKR